MYIDINKMAKKGYEVTVRENDNDELVGFDIKPSRPMYLDWSPMRETFQELEETLSLQDIEDALRALEHDIETRQLFHALKN